jgi:hypothetical protein
MHSIHLLLLTGFAASTALGRHADFQKLCELALSNMIQADPSLANNPQLKCGAQYSATTNYSLPIRVSLPFCIKENNGWQVSKVANLPQWAGPLVGFLVPALVFVLSIPRVYRIPREDNLFEIGFFRSVAWLLLIFCMLLIEVLLWIIVVFGLLGPMLAGTFHEAITDHKLLKIVSGKERLKKKSTPPDVELNGIEISNGVGNETGVDGRDARYAIAITLLGTFKPCVVDENEKRIDLEQKVVDEIRNGDPADAKEKLRKILTLHPSFGIQVAAPVLFYLGAYVYSLLDAATRLGDNDTAHSIAFGIWYGVIVLLATISCCVLGITSPATLEGVFGKQEGVEVKSYRYFRSGYQPSWLWNRGKYLRMWGRKSADHDRAPTLAEEINKALTSRWLRFRACVLAILAMGILCALAFTISYTTPRKGLSCRSVTILSYFCGELWLVIFWFYYNEENPNPWTYRPVFCLSAFACVCTIFISIGGSMMQLLGVYRNCICRAGLRFLVHRASGVVELATDTLEHRKSGKIWLFCGGAGILCIFVVCLCSWGYQVNVREECMKQINATAPQDDEQRTADHIAVDYK